MKHLTRLCRAASTLWTGPFPIEEVSGYVLLFLTCFIETSLFNANSVHPDQTRLIRSTLFANTPFKGRHAQMG